MKQILTLLTVLALVAVAFSAQLPVKKDGATPPAGDLKTASSFVGPFGFGWGWGYPYIGYGKGWGGYGYGGWGYPYWG